MTQTTTKLLAVGHSLAFVIPKPLLDELGWKRGQQVEVILTAGRRVILKGYDAKKKANQRATHSSNGATRRGRDRA